MHEVIQPELRAGKLVVCDRFTDSTIAYQHYGRGLDLKLANSINEAATGGLKPDLTLLIDVPVEVGLTRKGNKKPDRFETEKAAFHQKVRNGYLQMAATEPKRWVIINACQTREQIAGMIWERVLHILPNQK